MTLKKDMFAGAVCISALASIGLLPVNADDFTVTAGSVVTTQLGDGDDNVTGIVELGGVLDVADDDAIDAGDHFILTNSGSISGGKDSVKAENDGQVTNNLSGTITGANDGVQLDERAEVINSGEIRSLGDDNSGVKIESGKVTNNGEILASGAPGEGERVYDVSVIGGGEVINHGNIFASGDAKSADDEGKVAGVRVEGDGGKVTNTGVIRADGAILASDDPEASANGKIFGVRFQAAESSGSEALTLDNEGRIIATKDAVRGDDDNVNLHVINGVDGLLRGNTDSGISAQGDGVVENRGIIEGRGDDGIDFDGTATINNSGSIAASGGDGGANSREGVSIGGGEINNFLGGKIVSVDNGVYFVISASDNPTQTGNSSLSNKGEIIGTRGYGVRFFGEFNDTLTNSGVIKGGNGTAITMAKGDDTVHIEDGAIEGNIDGGAGVDTVNFKLGSGDRFTYADKVTQFEVVNFNSGIVLLNGAVEGANHVRVVPDAVLGGEGMIQAVELSNAGTLSPGTLSAGRFILESNFVQSRSGMLDIELSGLSAGDEYDVLEVSGEAILNGTLDVTLLDGFEPELGDTFDILLATLISGEFDETLLPVFAGQTFDVLYATDFVRLTTRPVPLPGAMWLFGPALLGLFGLGFPTRRLGISKKSRGCSMRTLGKFTALGIAACLAASAVAEEADLLDILLKKGTITQEEYEQLKKQQKPKPEVPATTEAGPQGVVVTTGGGLRGRSRDGSFTFRVGGRLQVDGAIYDNDQRDLGNGSEIRRARLDLEGTVWNDWGYKAEYDFAEDDVELKDAYIQYTGFEPIRIRIGHIKEPFSMEEQTSSLFITFMERALPNVFAPDRNIGVRGHTYSDHWTLDAGFFGEGVDDNNDSDGENDEGYGGSGRVTFAPIDAGTRLVHVGASVAYRGTGDDDEVRFRERPESHITNVRFVDTGTISDVDDMIKYGLEAAAAYGPFSAQGEYIRTHVNRDDGFSDLDFDGYYAWVSWLLTGESRPYRNRLGEFGRVKPKRIVGKGGLGAWEVALRYSNLDLDDGDIEGGKEDNITVGLNWYATPNIRFMANYIHVDSEKEDVDDDPDIFQFRGQVDF